MVNLKQKITNLFKPIDLTKGTPWKKILIFMIPILLSYVFQQVYTLSDAIIVGNTLTAPEVSGVNVVYALIFIVLQFAFGCTSGFSVITANKVGEKDDQGIRRSFATQISLSAIISLILTVIGILCIPQLLSIIEIKPNDLDYQYAYTYLFIIYLGLFTQIFYNLIVNVLRSLGDSLTPLLFLIFSTILNIGLDYLLILVFKWGVAGAAIATIFAQFVAFIACFIYALKKYPVLRIKLRDFKFDFKENLEHLKLGIPLALNFSILAIGLITLEKAMVKFDYGATIEAGVAIFDSKLAYGATTKFNDFLMVPFSSLGSAMLSYAGQNRGARDFDRLKKGLKQSIILMFIMYIILLILGIALSYNGLFTHFFLSEANNNENVRWYAQTYMYIDASLYFILGFLFIGRNYLQGIGKALCPFLAGIGELIGRIVLAEFMPIMVDPGNIYSQKAFVGVCFSDPAAWLLACLFLGFGIYYYIIKGKLKTEIELELKETEEIEKQKHITNSNSKLQEQN